MSFKCELCGGKTKKVGETERNEFWKCEKRHLIKEVISGNAQVRNVNAPVFMVAKPLKKP
jgi:DNA-directed RNA polymerase subunit RPC12/RpoP